MSHNYKSQFSQKRLKCADLFEKHKKTVYCTNRMNFQRIGDSASRLQALFPSEIIQSSDYVCYNCFKQLRDISDTVSDGDELSCSVDDSESLAAESEDFQLANSEAINYFNSEVIKNFSSVSPLKQKGQLSNVNLTNYVDKKSSEIRDDAKSKIQKLYDVNLEYEQTRSAQDYKSEWSFNFSEALKNCSNTSEKIRLLTLVPKSFSKFDILSAYPEVTAYMIDASRKLVKTKGKYNCVYI